MSDFKLPNHPLLDREYWGKSKADVIAEIEGMLEDYHNPLLPYINNPFVGYELKYQLEIIQRLRPYVPDLVDQAYEKLFNSGQPPPESFSGYTPSKDEFRHLVSRLPDPRSYYHKRSQIVLPFFRDAHIAYSASPSMSEDIYRITFNTLDGRRGEAFSTIIKLTCWGIGQVQVTDWIETGEPPLTLEYAKSGEDGKPTE